MRGSGRACVAGGAATAITGAAGLAGAAWAGGGVDGFTGAWLRRAASSSSCFLARIAFITSPGLEMCDRSIFGWTAWCAREDWLWL